LSDIGEERFFQSEAKGKPHHNAAPNRNLDHHGSGAKPQRASAWYVSFYYPPEPAPDFCVLQMSRVSPRVTFQAQQANSADREIATGPIRSHLFAGLQICI